MNTLEDIRETETVLDDFMMNGVRFIEIKNGNSSYFMHVTPDEEVNPTSLTDPREFDDPNYTFARLDVAGEKVMVDDDGIHRDW